MAKISQNILNSPGIKLALSMSGWLVGPVILATIVGQGLDRRYHTKPWLFLASLGIAFAITLVGLIRSVNDTLKKIDQEATSDKTKSSDKK